MNSFLEQNIRDIEGAILAQWVADERGCVGPSGNSPITGVLIVYTSGARGVFSSRGGTHTLTITKVGSTVPTVFSACAHYSTPDEFVVACLSPNSTVSAPVTSAPATTEPTPSDPVAVRSAQRAAAAKNYGDELRSLPLVDDGSLYPVLDRYRAVLVEVDEEFDRATR